MSSAYERTYIPSSKTAVLYYSDFYSYFIRHSLNKTKPPKLLKERYMLESLCPAFPPRHFLYDVFDRKLQQYIEADLVNYNIRVWNEDNNPEKYEEFKEPFEVLTFEELEAGFVVCFVPLAFAILVFVVEWMSTLKELTVFWFVFRKYFDMKTHEQLRHSEVMKARFALWQAIIREKNQKNNTKTMKSISLYLYVVGFLLKFKKLSI